MLILSFARKTVDYISRFLAYIAMWGVFAMMLLVVVDVAMRVLLSRSTLIADEMGGYLLVLIAYLGMSEAYRLGRHIYVDIVTSRLPGRLTAWLDVVLCFIGLVALIIVTWRVVVMVHRSYIGNVTIPGIFLTPVYLPQTLIIIGLIALALQCIVDLSESFCKLMQISNGPHARAIKEVSQE